MVGFLVRAFDRVAAKENHLSADETSKISNKVNVSVSSSARHQGYDTLLTPIDADEVRDAVSFL